MANDDTILSRAEFDPRLPMYFMLQAQFGLLVSIIGIPLMPIWLLLGRGIHRRQYENLECVLTDRALKVKRGVLIKVQKSIPLDKITDLALTEGPILRYLGLCSLAIETAGGGQTASTGQAALPGVSNAETFRDLVLAQRDRIALGERPSAAPTAAAKGDPSLDGAVLADIRDTLARIERLIDERSSRID